MENPPAREFDQTAALKGGLQGGRPCLGIINSRELQPVDHSESSETSAARGQASPSEQMFDEIFDHLIHA